MYTGEDISNQEEKTIRQHPIITRFEGKRKENKIKKSFSILFYSMTSVEMIGETKVPNKTSTLGD